MLTRHWWMPTSGRHGKSLHAGGVHLQEIGALRAERNPSRPEVAIHRAYEIRFSCSNSSGVRNCVMNRRESRARA
jgi:hypothetical protein